MTLMSGEIKQLCNQNYKSCKIMPSSYLCSLDRQGQSCLSIILVGHVDSIETINVIDCIVFVIELEENFKSFLSNLSLME
jgi:hypothetical protein